MRSASSWMMLPRAARGVGQAPGLRACERDEFLQRAARTEGCTTITSGERARSVTATKRLAQAAQGSGASTSFSALLMLALNSV